MMMHKFDDDKSHVENLACFLDTMDDMTHETHVDFARKLLSPTLHDNVFAVNSSRVLLYVEMCCANGSDTALCGIKISDTSDAVFIAQNGIMHIFITDNDKCSFLKHNIEYSDEEDVCAIFNTTRGMKKASGKFISLAAF